MKLPHLHQWLSFEENYQFPWCVLSGNVYYLCACIHTHTIHNTEYRWPVSHKMALRTVGLSPEFPYIVLGEAAFADNWDSSVTAGLNKYRARLHHLLPTLPMIDIRIRTICCRSHRRSCTFPILITPPPPPSGCDQLPPSLQLALWTNK